MESAANAGRMPGSIERRQAFAIKHLHTESRFTVVRTCAPALNGCLTGICLSGASNDRLQQLFRGPPERTEPPTSGPKSTGPDDRTVAGLRAKRLDCQALEA